MRASEKAPVLNRELRRIFGIPRGEGSHLEHIQRIKVVSASLVVMHLGLAGYFYHCDKPILVNLAVNAAPLFLQVYNFSRASRITNKANGKNQISNSLH